jgi:hypothetical protein
MNPRTAAPRRVRSDGLKTVTLALAAAAVVGLIACGGGGSKEPLTIDQRVPSAEDAPGSKADPVETPVSVSSADEFISKLGDRFINPTPQDVAKFKSSGFLRALHKTRFIPKEPGGPHTMTAPHIFSLVMQFKTEDGANTALDIVHTDSLRPCPETCATQVEEFDPGFDDATGTRRYATAESIQATGDQEVHPFDRYEIDFADGVFAYRIELSGRPPGAVTEEEAEEIAKSLYERVQGAPAE